MSTGGEKKGAAAHEVIKKHRLSLFGYIKSKVSKIEDAEDVLQDVWYQLSKLTNLHDLENVAGWLYRVAANKITDLYRKKEHHSLDDLLYVQNGEDEEQEIKEILLLDDKASPEMAMFKDAFWEELMAALDELPESQREVFIMNEMDGKTLQEIADTKNENIKTIISRKGYAVKHLRSRLKQLYNDLK